MISHKSTVLITGAAGFIGSTLADALLKKGASVIAVDNFNDYYNPRIKTRNIADALKKKTYKLYKADIFHFLAMERVFKKEKPNIIIHLAARAGVRPSLENPTLYAEVNKVGTVNLLKLAVDYKVDKFIFASSSSVYGNSKRIPFSEDDRCEFIISPYGASKRSAEIFIEMFYKMYGLKSVILRFFTVYGPRGRPDMAPALFTRAVISGEVINQFGNGTTYRDYTYIDDIIAGIEKTIEADVGFEIFNLGNNNPVSLAEFIRSLEMLVGKKAKINKLPLQIGDVKKTWANIDKAKKLLGWEPKVKINEGLKGYIEWLKKIH
ncbi:MAG: GDP-mannose 4,6-dehydratase [Patescibacteria group bacterium]